MAGILYFVTLLFNMPSQGSRRQMQVLQRSERNGHRTYIVSEPVGRQVIWRRAIHLTANNNGTKQSNHHYATHTNINIPKGVSQEIFVFCNWGASVCWWIDRFPASLPAASGLVKLTSWWTMVDICAIGALYYKEEQVMYWCWWKLLKSCGDIDDAEKEDHDDS